MEDRNGRARSAMESMRRRQLEARRLSEASPMEGLGTYQVIRPSRGREVVRPPAPVVRPPRLPDGSDAFGTIDRNEVRAAEPSPPDVAAPLYRAEIAPPPPDQEKRLTWVLPIALAGVISAILITLALTLR